MAATTTTILPTAVLDAGGVISTVLERNDWKDWYEDNRHVPGVRDSVLGQAYDAVHFGGVHAAEGGGGGSATEGGGSYASEMKQGSGVKGKIKTLPDTKAAAYTAKLTSSSDLPWSELDGAWLSTYSIPPKAVFSGMDLGRHPENVLPPANASVILLRAALQHGVRPAGIICHHKVSSRAGSGSGAEPTFRVPLPPGSRRVYIDGKCGGETPSVWAP